MRTSHSSFAIGALNNAEPHLLADLIELLVVLGVDGRKCYSPADIESILVTATGGNSKGASQSAVKAAWPQFSYRSGRFDRAYPFVVDKHGIGLRVAQNSESRVYIFLLACSRLRSFHSKLRQKWAAGFSELSVDAMRALVPDWAAARSFDANSSDRRSYYGTNARDALLVLGKDIGARSTDQNEIAKLSASGDYRIDVVGVCDFNDGAHTHHALLGQCAARGEDWPTKRLEAHSISLSGVFFFNHPPANVVFTPVSFRQTNGSWIDNTSVSAALVIDRWRLVFLLRKSRRLSRVAGSPWMGEFESVLVQIRHD